MVKSFDNDKMYIYDNILINTIHTKFILIQ